MRKFKWILFVIILLMLSVIVFRNLEETTVELVFTSLNLPLAALLTVTLLIGFCLGLFASALWKVRSWRAHRAKSKQDPSGSSSTKST